MAKKATRKKTTKSNDVPFGSKSDKIREVLDSGIVKPALVVAELKSKGVEVTTGLVASVKQKHGKRKKKDNGQRTGNGRKGNGFNNGRTKGGGLLPDGVKTVVAGLRLLEEFGSVEKAQKFLAALGHEVGN